MRKSVVLLSGGIDSTTTLAVAKSTGFDVHALSVNYGQRHSIELKAAKRVSDLVAVRKHLVIDVNLRDIGGSALTSDIEVPKGRGSGQRAGAISINQSPDLHPPSQIPITYVPARNTIFLSFALAWAEVLGAEDIFIGANAVDYSGYPDCRPEFIKAFEDLANLATKMSFELKAKFKIHAPLINLTKGEIIKKGVASGIDYSLTWSCYDPRPADEGFQVADPGSPMLKEDPSRRTLPAGRQDKNAGFIPCGICDSCLLRAKGFKEAGMDDPLRMLK